MNPSIKQYLTESLKESQNVFDTLTFLIGTARHKPAHTLQELKDKNTKLVGDLWEEFCKMYLIQKGFNAKFIHELSLEERQILKLNKQDVGIDIIAYKDNLVFAVQCKYRSKTVDKMKRTVHRVSWRDVSTFIALCTTTGPYAQHIIMTNADYVTRYGHKNEQDITIAKKTFQNESRDFWMACVGYTYNKVEKEEKETNESNMIEIRDKRQAWLNKLMK
jgi:HJR/Mrr/RecB family endonuclease